MGEVRVLVRRQGKDVDTVHYQLTTPPTAVEVYRELKKVYGEGTLKGRSTPDTFFPSSVKSVPWGEYQYSLIRRGNVLFAG